MTVMEITNEGVSISLPVCMRIYSALESKVPGPGTNFIFAAISPHSAKISDAKCSVGPRSCVLWARGAMASLHLGVASGAVP